MGGTIIILIIVGVLLMNFVKKKIDFPDASDSEELNEDKDESPYHQTSSANHSSAAPKEKDEREQPTSKPSTPAGRSTASTTSTHPFDMPDINRGNKYGRLYGIIGKPLEHSISIVHFKKFFKEQGINADYSNFEIDDIAQLKDIINNNPNLCGLNVTIPYKQDVIQYMDHLDDTAAKVGAVNVIKIDRHDGNVELTGYNTDALGFMESIRPLVGDRKKALILGTGGVSKAVKYGLDQLGIESKFVSRNSNFDVLGYFELSPSIIEDHQIIVNCTPVGMWPNDKECPEIPYADLESSHLLYDVIYNPEETMFMQKGKYYGATVKNGFEMWQLQADATWRIWNQK